MSFTPWQKVIHRRDVLTKQSHLVVFTVRNLTFETRPKFRVTRFWRVQGADRGTKAVSGAFIRKLHLGLKNALDASAVAKLLHEFGQRTALRGGNPYRARAYSRAAQNLLALTMPIDQIVAEDRLREIPGVGEAIADIIAKLHKTGTHAGLEAMRKDIPAGVLDLLSVPGLRPEKVLKLYSELGIASLEGLEQAARQDRLKWLPDTSVRWRDVWFCAAITAAFFEIGKLLISVYIGKQALESTYGAAASRVVLLVIGILDPYSHFATDALQAPDTVNPRA